MENIAKHIENKMKNNVINLAGELTLNDLVYTISRLDLLITNDSGPMHIGAACGIPLVALFGPQDPRICYPYTSIDKYTVIYKHLDCQPCEKKECEHISCLMNISTDEVFGAAKKMLSSILSDSS